MKDIVIFGVGGHAHVIADAIKLCGDRVIAFLDDDVEKEDCAGPISSYINYANCEFIIGIGSCEVRNRLSQLDLKWHTVIHPSAIISPSAIIGEGTVVMANAVINSRSKIGKHCIINTGAILEHDNSLGDFSHLSVGAKTGGTVTIGKNTLIGIGASIRNNLSICDNCVIGAGATVVKDINESGTYLGLPARKVK